MITLLSERVARKYKGKTALVRIDLNVDARSAEGLYRVRAAMPTIRMLRKAGVRVVLISHKGRPRGVERALSLKPFASILEKELKESVRFIATFDGDAMRSAIASCKESVVLLENIRFLPGEEKNDAKFAKQLASLGDLYVNEAFAVSHRAHASVHKLAKLLPAYAGLQFACEVTNLDAVMKRMAHPFVVIFGGAKIEDKLPLIKHFWKEADIFLTGGGPGNTLLAAQGIPMHDSLYSKALVSQVRKYAFAAKVMSPTDARCDGAKMLDIGEETAQEYGEIIASARTVVWNGPVGLFERKEFAGGTAALWKAVINNTKARVVVGGGETIASLSAAKKHPERLPKHIFLSTGGGAMLEYLAGKKLPGVEALR